MLKSDLKTRTPETHETNETVETLATRVVYRDTHPGSRPSPPTPVANSRLGTQWENLWAPSEASISTREKYSIDKPTIK